MPLLRADDPLPYRPGRVTVNGTSGSGKSTLARRIGEALALPYTELDSLYHGPGWTPMPDFLKRVEEMTSSDRWVCELQFDAARPMIVTRADLVVWLDLPLYLVMSRLTGRTIGRRVGGHVLWNGNREGPLRHFFTDREHVIRWAWATRHEARARARALLVSHPRLPLVRLRTPEEVSSWVCGPLSQSAGG